jgi:hypothetical protein
VLAQVKAGFYQPTGSPGREEERQSRRSGDLRAGQSTPLADSGQLRDFGDVAAAAKADTRVMGIEAHLHLRPVVCPELPNRVQRRQSRRSRRNDVAIPVSVSVFPGERYPAPRSWAQRAYKDRIYFNELDIGGHFAAWQQPELFSEEVGAGFRPLR